jgi:Uma2 family endonuclease
MLRSHVRERGCTAFNSDCKVGLTDQGPFTCSDVSVSCDDRDRSTQEFIQFPCLIIEVLSPSTEA